MISTLTPAVARFDAIDPSGILGAIATVALLLLLVQREWGEAAGGRLRVFSRSLGVPIVGLVMVFGIVVLGRLALP
jgi:hypothetical protein